MQHRPLLLLAGRKLVEEVLGGVEAGIGRGSGRGADAERVLHRREGVVVGLQGRGD